MSSTNLQDFHKIL